MSFTFLNELPTPAEIKKEYPLSDALKALKKKRDEEISNVIRGKDDRFLVIILDLVPQTILTLYVTMSAA